MIDKFLNARQQNYMSLTAFGILCAIGRLNTLDLDQTWANYGRGPDSARKSILCGPPTLVETSMYRQTSVFERLAVLTIRL